MKISLNETQFGITLPKQRKKTIISLDTIKMKKKRHLPQKLINNFIYLYIYFYKVDEIPFIQFFRWGLMAENSVMRHMVLEVEVTMTFNDFSLSLKFIFIQEEKKSAFSSLYLRFYISLEIQPQQYIDRSEALAYIQ